MMLSLVIGLMTCAAAIGQPAVRPVEPLVRVERTPSEGIQPQALVGSDGRLHLLYYKGDAKGGDLFYTHRPADVSSGGWSKAVRVNSQERSAVAMGNDRGGQIALGKGGAVHVAWNGVAAGAKGAGSPMLYARLAPGADRFSPQRNLMTASDELDGGGSVAADDAGHVYVVWHAHPSAASEKGETARRVFVSRSSDDGQTFEPERAVSDAANGACGCCGLKASVVPGPAKEPELLVLYRAAGGGTQRDARLLRSTDAEKTFTDTCVDPWKLNTCPMSTFSIAAGKSAPLLAWETNKEVRWTTLTGGTPGQTYKLSDESDGKSGRRFPSVAVDEQGRVLVAWTEGVAWARGGRVAWQVFDADGKPRADGRGSADGVPAWSLVAAVARPGGGFTVIY